MVVLIIDQYSIGVFKGKSQSPVRIYGNSPAIDKVAGKLV